MFLDLYNEWFSNRCFWFDKVLENDKYLSGKYFNKIELTEYTEDSYACYSVKELIGAIIAYDQIPRCHNRIQRIDRTSFSLIAVDISVSLMTYLSTNIDAYKSVSAYEWCFILLPYMHINDREKINTIIRFVIEKHNNVETTIDEKNVFRKFLYSTIVRAHKNNTKECLSQAISHTNPFDRFESVSHLLLCDSFTGFQESMKTIDRLAVFTALKKEVETFADGNIIVPVSGSANSFVRLFLAKIVCKNNSLCVIHIKEEGEAGNQEANFVKSFCCTLGIDLYCRPIHEIHMTDCHTEEMRALYDNVVKKITYDTYQQVGRLFDNGKTTHVLSSDHKNESITCS